MVPPRPPGPRGSDDPGRRRDIRAAHRRVLSQQAAEKALKALKASRFSLAIGVPKIHGLSQLLDRSPETDVPEIGIDDLDLLDPWVIDGRYAADLPDLERLEADRLLAAARRVVDAVSAARSELESPRTS